MSDGQISQKLWIATFLTATPSFVFGFALAALNSCLVTGGGNSETKCFNSDDDDSDPCPIGTIYNDLDLNSTKAQVATALGILGAWCGSLAGSKPSDRYGRKWTLLVNNVPIMLGAILTSVGDEYCLYVGRFILGLGVGVGSVVAPVLLSEIAHKDNAGTITSIHQLMITLAIFLVAILAYGFVTYVSHGWQYVQAFVVIPCALMIVGSDHMYESPKWLVERNRKEEAKQVISALRVDDHDVDGELDSLQLENKDNGDNEEVSWTEVFVYQHGVIVGCGLMSITALTGINTVIFYSTTIFGFAGFHEAILATSSVGLVNFAATFVATKFTDKWGRKFLVMTGTSIMLVALLMLSAVLAFGNDDEQTQGYFAVFATLLYVVGFSCGLGPVSWVIMSEMLPTRVRTKAYGLFLSINWFWNLCIGLLTLTAIDGLGGVTDSVDDDDEIAKREKAGVSYLYFMFACLTVAALAFIQYVVPETKGKTAEQLMGMRAPLLMSIEDDK